MSNFEWLPTESAPERAPVHLVRGDLYFADGGSIYIPDGRDVANGWGEWGSTHIVGAAVKPVPVRLDLTWFSYLEDRFFGGSFMLPTATMTTLFRAGVADPQTEEFRGFERIVVGMAPEGLVAVWMSTGSEAIEVASFIAPEVDLPWERVLDNPASSRPAFIRQVLAAKLNARGLARLGREGTPRGLYQSYRRQYNWRPTVTGEGMPTGLWIRSFNGERAFIGCAGPAIPRERRPVPAAINLGWMAPDGGARFARLTFDETEIFAAFAKLSRGDAARVLALELETARTTVAISLRDEKYVLPLEKVLVELFSTR
ncbi:DUF2931 family protein [Sorangium sp. So ce426]|uniref:DUF2931 family protein n=1 Tax=Sorangium sp. So ce426 TaxID=3133312 RepID=UPI003F5BC408